MLTPLVVLCFVGFAVGGALVTVCGEVIKEFLTDVFSRINKK